MKILSKQFAELATAWTNWNEFSKARFKLTAQYLLILFLVLNVFTFSVWGILQYNESRYQEKVQVHWQKKSIVFPDSSLQIIQVQQVSRPLITKEEILDWQHAFLQNLKRQILWLEAVLLIFAGFCSYWLAGKNLQPIKKKMEHERQFLSDVGHELKNPLAAIQTTLEVAKAQKSWKKAELDEVFSDLLQEIKRLTKLTDDLLFLEKPAQKSREILDLDEILKNVQKTLKSFARERGIKIKISRKNQLPIRGNRSDLTKLFFNLVHNAIKFSDPPHPVQIKISGKTVSIENIGKTISPKFRGKIFQRFTKQENSRDFQTGGNGLGLAIVKKIADAHHAQISFTSEKGKTIFQVKFP